MRRRLLLAAGVVALAASIPLALLGRAVLAAPAVVSRASADWPSSTAPVSGTSLQERAAARLLDARRAERLFAIARAYRRAALSPAIAVTSVTPVRLAELTRRLGSPQERAQAHVMVGAIFALPAGNGSVSFDVVRQLGGGRLLRQAAAEFRAAATIDDRNESAKYDLELLLKPEAASRASRRSRRSRDRSATRRSQTTPRRRSTSRRIPSRERGAAAYKAGSGY